MNARKPTSFTPPSAAQVKAYLDHYPPRPTSRRAVWLLMAALGASLVLSVTVANTVTVILPWLLLGALFMAMSWRVRWARRLEARANHAQELTMVRRWSEALRESWRLLPSLVTLPELHGRAVAFIAHNLDQLKASEAAIVAYDYLIDRLPPDHPGAVQLRIQRAMAQLATDQLTDADDTLRRLRGVVDNFQHTPISASYRLANLIQQTRTNHYADAVADSSNLLEELRPLGIDAGYGHALIALAYFSLPEPEHREQAGQWWSRATLLLPVAALVARFAELAPLGRELVGNTSSAKPPAIGGRT